MVCCLISPLDGSYVPGVKPTADWSPCPHHPSSSLSGQTVCLSVLSGSPPPSPPAAPAAITVPLSLHTQRKIVQRCYLVTSLPPFVGQDWSPTRPSPMVVERSQHLPLLSPRSLVEDGYPPCGWCTGFKGWVVLDKGQC